MNEIQFQLTAILPALDARDISWKVLVVAIWNILHKKNCLYLFTKVINWYYTKCITLDWSNKKVITFYELRSRVFCFANYEISRNTVFIFSVVIIKDKLHFLCYLDFFFIFLILITFWSYHQVPQYNLSALSSLTRALYNKIATQQIFGDKVWIIGSRIWWQKYHVNFSNQK